MNFGMYWFSDRVVLRMYKARVIGPEEAPELYEMVDRLRQRADLPMPVVAVAPSDQPNAFATGRNPEKAVVCVTAGIPPGSPAQGVRGGPGPRVGSHQAPAHAYGDHGCHHGRRSGYFGNHGPLGRHLLRRSGQ